MPDSDLGSPPESGLWCKGWYARAQHIDSPNFGARPAGVDLDLIVIHSISLPPGQFGNGRVQQLFTNQLNWDEHPYFQPLRGLMVSAHFFIDRTGRLYQFVSCDDRAWHAGPSSYRGRPNCNDYSIGIELEGIEGGLFENTQYQCLSQLCRALACQYAVRYIAGHEHIAPQRKCDPGSGFEWSRLKAATGLSALIFPPGT